MAASKRRGTARRRTGRPLGLTREVETAICDAVRAGAFLDQAAEHAGVGRSTVYRWLGRAASDPFRDFRDALTRARASAEVGAVAIVRKHMRDDWRAAAFYLERGRTRSGGGAVRCMSTRARTAARSRSPMTTGVSI